MISRRTLLRSLAVTAAATSVTSSARQMFGQSTDQSTQAINHILSSLGGQTAWSAASTITFNGMLSSPHAQDTSFSFSADLQASQFKAVLDISGTKTWHGKQVTAQQQADKTSQLYGWDPVHLLACYSAGAALSWVARQQSYGAISRSAEVLDIYRHSRQSVPSPCCSFKLDGSGLPTGVMLMPSMSELSVEGSEPLHVEYSNYAAFSQLMLAKAITETRSSGRQSRISLLDLRLNESSDLLSGGVKQ